MTEEKLTVSSGAVLRWRGGDLVVETSHSGGFRLVAEFVPLLDAFREPTEAQQGMAAFLERYAEGEERDALVDEVARLVQRLRREGVLVADGDDAPELIGGTFARAQMHVFLLSDYARTATYRAALAKHAPGKAVLEIGCGSGALACFAAKAGARVVYAIEQAAIIELAREVAAVNGLADNIVFVPGNSLDVELPERVDVIYSEIIGSDPLIQRMVPYLRDATDRFLAPGGVMIPEHLSILAVGVDSPDVRHWDYLNDHGLLSAEELGAAYGLDLSPLIAAYRNEIDEARRSFGAQESLGGPLLAYEQRTQEILTEEATILELDLADLSGEYSGRRALRMPVRRSGRQNAIAVYFRAAMDEELMLTTSPFGPQPAVAWGQLVRPLDERPVSRGQVVEVDAVLEPDRSPTISFEWSGTADPS